MYIKYEYSLFVEMVVSMKGIGLLCLRAGAKDLCKLMERQFGEALVAFSIQAMSLFLVLQGVMLMYP